MRAQVCAQTWVITNQGIAQVTRRRGAGLSREPKRSAQGSPAADLGRHARSLKAPGLGFPETETLGAPRGILSGLVGKGKLSLSSGPEAPFPAHRQKGRSWKGPPSRQGHNLAPQGFTGGEQLVSELRPGVRESGSPGPSGRRRTFPPMLSLSRVQNWAFLRS